MIDLNQFAEWQAEDPNRSVEIKLDGAGARAWVWDGSIMTGQFVKSVAEINLKAKKEQAERAEFERLRAKFEVKEKSSATGNGKED